MTPQVQDITALARACAVSDPARGAADLLAGLGRLWPDLTFKPTLTRGGWYRPGAVVDIDKQRVAQSLRLWAEAQTPAGDLQPLLDVCLQRQLFATRLVGRTHYLTAQTGPAALDFVQLEVEELEEVLDRYLSDPDWLPDSLEEFIDPLDYPHVEPERVDAPRLAFRRMFSARELLESTGRMPVKGLLQFMADWDRSSACRSGHFCDYWVLGVQESVDSDGETQTSVRAVPARTRERLAWTPGLGGAELANRIHGYDHEAGYLMAWFFHLVASKGVSHEVGTQVAHDHQQGFSYLPERDLELLRGWLAAPYGA